LLQRIPTAQKNEIDREVISAIQQHADGDTIKFGAVVVLASGTKGNGS